MTTFYWERTNCEKKLILGFQLCCSFKQPVPIASRGDSVIIQPCRKTIRGLVFALQFADGGVKLKRERACHLSDRFLYSVQPFD